MDLQPYRIAPTRPDTYGEAWAKLRRVRLLRRFGFGVLAAQMTFMWLIFGAPASPHEHVGDTFILLLVAALLGMTLVLQRFSLPFLCPRCGHPFFEMFLTLIGFGRHCMSCDLEVGTPTPLSDARNDDDNAVD